ncbi:serine/threonine kinase 16 [Dactylonectria estremocensis]|uniref:Serine/threonine kinase 16 n=1 Tax=Dactylonectria estremocensis TaxID=1079267 RepID=A0A9P9JBG9_9HYPO|nr:serine/threonine kinase 16 [Dactylonectria estremocensis]
MARDPEAQARISVEIYPGTELMEDYLGSHLTHSQNDRAGTVLVPQPSHNSDDPLNWSPFWKWTIVLNEVFFILTSVISALSVSPLTPVFEAQFNKDAEAIALLTSALVLVTGYANLILVPIAEVYGRRFILIASSLVCLGASLWHGASQSYGSFMGARILIGIGMSIGESLMPMVVSDVFFLHERGRFMGAYVFALFNGMFLGPIIAGECEKRFGSWRTFYWIISGFTGLSLLLIIFFHPETKYIRLPVDNGSAENTTPPSEKHDSEHAEASPDQNIDRDQFLGKGRPGKRQFRLFQSADSEAISKISRHVITPFVLLRFPIVLFGSWMLAFPASGLLTLNYTESMALVAAPYNFDNSQVGLSNLALVCGGTLGVFTAGPVSDWVAMYLTKRNNGIREPEMRLVSLVPFTILSAIALIVVGLGFDRSWPWQAIITVGFGGIGLMTVSLCTIGITYAVDCYKPVAGQIMTIATVLKNSFGFGMGHYVTDWVKKSGFVPLLMCEFALIIGPTVFGITFFSIYGKRLRKLSRNSKVHTY